MKVNKIFVVTILLVGSFACKKYEPYSIDFDYTAVYFATQKPLRTVVAYDNMQFKVGVALAGVRENKREEKVTFKIDPSLLTTVPGADRFKLLPANYYTLSNNAEMIISPGSLIGDITVLLNKELFIQDINAATNYYALPLRIATSTTDSILRGNKSVPAKDYTVLVVKYISPYSGFYYHKGIETNESTNTSVVYSLLDLSRNAVWELSTLAYDTILTTGVGTNNSAKLKLTIDNSHNVKVVAGNSVISDVSGVGTFNSAAKQYYLNYNYTINGVSYLVKDTLIQRQSPELDLRFEEW